MKKALPLVVMALALALCGLCVVQWVRESHLRAQIRTISQENTDKATTIGGLEARLKAWEADIQRLSDRVAELKAAEGTHQMALATTRRSLQKAEIDLAQAREQIAVYQAAIDTQNANLKTQNTALAQQGKVIEEQNGLLKELGTERNQAVEQLNARTREFNDVVEKYNALVKQIEEQQAKK